MGVVAFSYLHDGSLTGSVEPVPVMKGATMSGQMTAEPCKTDQMAPAALSPRGKATATEVKPLAPAEASIERLVERLVRIINDAYAVGEAIRSGEMLLATGDGRIEGCARVQPLNETTAKLGMLAVTPDRWGSGAGRSLVRSAEELMRSRGVTTMQLELLVPKGWVHPEKKRLRDWYTRLGYTVTRSASFEDVAAHLRPQLRVPCEFLIFHKRQ
jgi:GNAT superfamily N-acetyltransferase